MAAVTVTHLHCDPSCAQWTISRTPLLDVSFQIFRLVVVVGHIVIRARPRSFPRTPNSRFELVSLENAGRRPDRMWRESSRGGEILPDTSTE